MLAAGASSGRVGPSSVQVSLYDPALDRLAPFDGALSRYVLHHVLDPPRFVARQLEILRPEGILVVSDHTTDPLPERAAHHEAIERARDRTHTTNLTAGQLVDLFGRAGLEQITFAEESYVLDFDEWFDRGTPQDSKENVRAMILAEPAIRGFRAALQPGGASESTASAGSCGVSSQRGHRRDFLAPPDGSIRRGFLHVDLREKGRLAPPPAEPSRSVRTDARGGPHRHTRRSPTPAFQQS